MIRLSIYKLLLAWAACTTICGCSKGDDPTPNTTSDATICFGVQEVIDTRIAPTATTFDEGDKIGVFGYFNWWYSSTSENAMLKNYALEIGSNTSVYNTGVKWSFSTYSNIERKQFDVVAYYPYDADVHSTESDAAPYISFSAGALVYTYTPEHDFMVAAQSYSIWDTAYSSYDNMRDYLQDLDCIPLTFYRQMASVTLSITKQEDVEGDIYVSGATFHFAKGLPSTITFDNDSKTYMGDTELIELGYDTDAPTTANFDFTNKYSDDELTIDTQSTVLEVDAFFPPEAEIFKVVLNISGTGAGGYTTHTWHPHLGALSKNENYTLNIIIEPGRLN